MATREEFCRGGGRLIVVVRSAVLVEVSLFNACITSRNVLEPLGKALVLEESSSSPSENVGVLDEGFGGSRAGGRGWLNIGGGTERATAGVVERDAEAGRSSERVAEGAAARATEFGIVRAADGVAVLRAGVGGVDAA